jgi:hypothetical protein
MNVPVSRSWVHKPRRAIALFILLDTFCVGMGMGVPIFCIAFGFLAGWWIAAFAMAKTQEISDVLRRILLYSSLTSALTFVEMAAIWGSCVVMMFDPTADLANFGIPMILFEPTASFIGWLVLMIFISPFLQFLMTLFGACIHLLLLLKTRLAGDSAVVVS